MKVAAIIGKRRLRWLPTVHAGTWQGRAADGTRTWRPLCREARREPAVTSWHVDPTRGPVTCELCLDRVGEAARHGLLETRSPA